MSVALASGLALVVSSCAGDARPVNKERVGETTAAVTTPSFPPDISFDLVFPFGYALSRVALAASQDVLLGPLNRVLAINGTPGTVTNAGPGLVTVGSGSTIGDIVSTGNIWVLPLGTTAKSAQSSGTVSVGLGDTVPTIVQNAVLTPIVHRTITVTTPSNTQNNVIALPGASTVPPGWYGGVVISPGAIVTFTAGTYVIDNFALSLLGELKLDTTGGSVNVYVKNTATWNGTVVGDGTRFVFGYLGVFPLTLAGPFTGTALVPNAILNLGPFPATYQGTFFAQHIVLAPGVTVQEIATPLFAAGLTVSKTTACQGEQIEVKVDAQDAPPGSTVRINGIAGNHQFVEFGDAPGPRTIWASILTPSGLGDFVSVPVTMQQCTPAASAPPIVLHFWPAQLQKPNVVEFMVRGYDANNHEILPPTPATYSWSFGDGQTTTTTTPLVAHDYSSAYKPLNTYSYFTANVAVTTSTGTSTAQKVVPIWSLYAANRGKGVVQPPNRLSVSAANLALSVTNYEPTPITITQANVETIPCDPNLDPQPQSPTSLSVVISAGATATVNVPSPTMPVGACALGVHLLGSAPAGRVYTDGYARTKENPLLVQAVSDPTLLAYLNNAATMTANPSQFDEFELRQLYAQGRLPKLPLSIPAGTTYSAPNINSSCTPGDTYPIPGYICQPTADWVVVPGEVLNASKGNFIMDHGCGPIGQLLGAIGQNYSHTSTVVKNRVEVRHSTSSGDRMNDSVNYGSAALDANTLQYGFPGTAGLTQTYTMNQMTGYYCVSDPNGSGGSAGERGPCPPGTWKMGGELSPDPVTCTGVDTSPVPGIVVKPPPDASAAIHLAVAAVAAQALQIDGHYRFYMYSQAQTLLPGNSSVPWTGGTESTVCSSFDRLAAKGANLTLAPTTTPAGVLDGMQEYLPSKRKLAAQVLYANTSNQVLSACLPLAVGGGSGGLAVIGGAIGLLGGPLGVPVGAAVGGLVGAATGAEYCHIMNVNVANQVTNCFASDHCDDHASTDWQNPGPGVAVSPDDIANDWELPPNGNYGYNEPIFYAPVVFRHAYVWKSSPGAGSLTVTVVDPSNTPIAGANISVNTNPAGATDNNGKLVIPSLAAGTYDVEAQESSPPEFANHQTVVASNQAQTVKITLCQGITLANAAGCQQACQTSPDCSIGNGLACSNGACIGPVCIPTGCTQLCAQPTDCDNGFLCNTSNRCVAPPRVVKITSTAYSYVGVFDNDFFTGSNNQYYNPVINITCDPNGVGPNGPGTADYKQCFPNQDNDASNEIEIAVTCTEAPDTGSIVTQNTAHLRDGCGSDAQDEDTYSVQTWTQGVAWGTSTEFDGVALCYTDDVFPPDPAGCGENYAYFHLVYANGHP